MVVKYYFIMHRPVLTITWSLDSLLPPFRKVWTQPFTDNEYVTLMCSNIVFLVHVLLTLVYILLKTVKHMKH